MIIIILIIIYLIKRLYKKEPFEGEVHIFYNITIPQVISL